MNLINKIDEYLLETNRKPRESHYPSDVNSCLRQLWYKWNDEPQSDPIEAGAYWKMNMGNAIHDLINEFLESAGFDIMSEIANKKNIDGLEYPISYRIDNIFMEDDKLSIIEVKSSYGAGIKNIQRQGKPRENDVYQILMYMYLEEIHKGYLLYIGRDNGYRTQFVIENRDRTIYIDGQKTRYNFKDLINRLKLVEFYYKNDEMPKKDYQVAIKNGEIRDKFQHENVVYKSDWQCMYCQWLNKCWAVDKITYEKSNNSEKFNVGDTNE